jgi:hypothetical protein
MSSRGLFNQSPYFHVFSYVMMNCLVALARAVGARLMSTIMHKGAVGFYQHSKLTTFSQNFPRVSRGRVRSQAYSVAACLFSKAMEDGLWNRGVLCFTQTNVRPK